jgi:diguanylate cyclase (GGDEF)-like protein
MDDHPTLPDLLNDLHDLRERIRRQHARPSHEQVLAMLAPHHLDAQAETAVRHWVQAAMELAESRPAAAEERLEIALGPLAVDAHADLAAMIRIDLADARLLQNRYAEVLAPAHLAADHWRAKKDSLREAQALSWVGLALTQLGRYKEAFEVLHGVLDAYSALGVEYRASRVINCIGIVHEELGDYREAFAMYKRALHCAERDGDPDMQGRALANWGEGEVSHGDIDQGIALLERAIDVLQGIGAYWHSGWCQLAIGRARMKQGHLDEAVQWAEQALDAVHRGDSIRMHAEVRAGFGEILMACGEFARAEQHLRRALEIASSAGIDREVFKTHHLLSQLYKKQARHELALSHHEQFFEVRAKVYDELARSKIDSMRTEFELERAQRDREISRLRNVELAQALEDVQRLNAELRDKAQVLEELSHRDALTGLYNRRYLHTRMAGEIQRLARYGSVFSVAFYDIDRFKQVNDRYSHAVGDKVLATVATLINGLLRESDCHARFGGEEFAIVLPGTTRAEALLALEKLRARVAAEPWSAIAPGLTVTISAGVAEMGPGETMESVFNRADARLYEAKGGGRNRVCG